MMSPERRLYVEKLDMICVKQRPSGMETIENLHKVDIKFYNI